MNFAWTLLDDFGVEMIDFCYFLCFDFVMLLELQDHLGSELIEVGLRNAGLSQLEHEVFIGFD